MGYMVHHAIVVTGICKPAEPMQGFLYIDDAYKYCVNLAHKIGAPQSITNITEQATNCYASFLIAPDGSKEGWETSDKGDEFRDSVCEYLLKEGFSFAEVKYGDEECNNALLRSDCDLEENAWT